MDNGMKNWKAYLEIHSSKGSAAAWRFAQKNFSKDSAEYESAQRHNAPTIKQRNESAARMKAIEQEINPLAIKQNCRF